MKKRVHPLEEKKGGEANAKSDFFVLFFPTKERKKSIPTSPIPEMESIHFITWIEHTVNVGDWMGEILHNPCKMVFD